jgi:hypothetical protein
MRQEKTVKEDKHELSREAARWDLWSYGIP